MQSVEEITKSSQEVKDLLSPKFAFTVNGKSHIKVHKFSNIIRK